VKIYEVIFTDSRDRDGDRDAIFLVRAEDFRSAVAEVFQNSGERHHCSTLPHTVYEIGEELYTFTNNYPHERKILRGPYYESAFNFGWREWRRKDLEPEETGLGQKLPRKHTWEEVARESQ
jgi:hypothetical protein